AVPPGSASCVEYVVCTVASGRVAAVTLATVGSPVGKTLRNAPELPDSVASYGEVVVGKLLDCVYPKTTGRLPLSNATADGTSRFDPPRKEDCSSAPLEENS